ncbi:ATP-dependent DNA helicase RecG [hydrothermal vent metagenome]|uniref:ATP-dependent DNA helicase RecG n=1 Tax=hydrothermal vent metagenome TaxID=652676 RepID=A0A3B0QU64_9ZZZZ
MSNVIQNKSLQGPLQYVKGIGPKLGERLAKKGLTTIEDVLYFLPIRYEDRSLLTTIRDLTVGSRGGAIGEVMVSGEVRYGRRRGFEVVISDGTGILKLKWFNFKLQYVKGRFKQGARIKAFGNITAYGAQKEIVHPDIEVVGAEGDADGDAADLSGGAILPVYSQIENFHQKTIRRIIDNIVEDYAAGVIGAVPRGVLEARGLLTLTEAFKKAHLPEDVAEVELARRSIVFDELFSLELGLALKRRAIKKEGGLALGGGDAAVLKRLGALIPFELTQAQRRVIREIKRDMASPHPMNRLLQGDVGSGKTIVSLIAALIAIDSGHQAAIMAPTEILAKQHCQTIQGFAEGLGIKVLLLTGSTKKTVRSGYLADIKDGLVDIVVGTHALIQGDIEFKSLGLAVIDEQHRFGVEQRGILKKKARKTGEGKAPLTPDILVMTATPIPRTLSMTVFGELDVSVIDELPKGRQLIKTRLMRESQRQEAYSLLRTELERGSQAYVVYPLVEESEELELRDATRMREHLAKDVFPEYKVVLLHGRMKGAEKEAVMADFKEGRSDVLVSTTVIEVGVDVPNATVILIEHAERFGLAQLHQLRGRVGRGERSSTCILLAQYTPNEDTWKRLKVIEGTTDGFRIAEEDLKIRGPGDFIGTRQSGMPEFRTSDTFADLGLLKTAREDAKAFLELDPELTTPEGAPIKEILRLRWKDRLSLAEVG